MNKRLLIFALIFAVGVLILFTYSKRQVESPEVVVSIKPIHSLVCALTKGITQPKLLLDGYFSPHHAHLTPSQVKMLNHAKLLIWIGKIYEQPLVAHLKNARGAVLAIADSTQLKLKSLRSGTFWDQHAECHHGHDHHNHLNCDHHHDAGNLDGHLWLDPLMMVKVVDVILPKLKTLYPKCEKLLEANANAYKQTLKNLHKELAAKMQQCKGKTYIIQHDGNQYFDSAFGVSTIATISIDPNIPPSAGHMVKIKKAIAEGKIHPQCLFAERQIDGTLAKNYAKTLNIPFGTLDYLGADIPVGAHAYEQLMNAYVEAFFDGISKK